MLKVAQSQYIERWDVLPVILRETLFSPAKGELIWRVGEEHHLNDEQIGEIAGICGNIVMGFLHPEDLAKEIKTDLGLDERLAGAIAREIDKKVLSEIRSEIDKVYAPPAPVVSDILEAPAPGPAEPLVAEERKEELPRESAVSPPESAVEGEMINLETFEKTPPAAETPSAAAPAPLPEAAPEAAAEAAAGKETAPIIILHEEPEIKPIIETPKSFSLSGFFDFLKRGKTSPAEEAPRVEIETEDLEAGLEDEPLKKETPARVVHYTETGQRLPEEVWGLADVEKSTEAEKLSEPILAEEQNNKVQSIGPASPPNLPTETSAEEGAETPKETNEDVIDLRTFEKK